MKNMIKLESYWWIKLNRALTDDEASINDVVTFEVEENTLKNILKENFDNISVDEFLDTYTYDESYEVFKLLKIR